MMGSAKKIMVFGILVLFPSLACGAVDFEVTPGVMTFTGYESSNNPDPNVICIYNHSNNTINWQIVDADEVSLSLPDWLSLSSTSALMVPHSQQDIYISIDITGLSVGTYQYSFDVVTNIQVPRQRVTVRMNILGPILEVFETSFSSTAYEGSANPDGNVVTIKNAGGGAMEWFIADTGDISLSLPQWLSINPANGILDPNQNELMSLSYNIEGLSDGNYQYTFDVIAPAAQNNPQTVTVDLAVIGPILELSHSNIYFYADENGPNPEDKTFTVLNNGGGIINWTANFNDKPDWLNISPVSGSLSKDQRDTVSLSVDITGLPTGYYTYSFDIQDLSTASSPKTIQIDLTVDFEKYDWSSNYGTGDPNNPYQVSTPRQLMSIGLNTDLLDKHFILLNDIIFDPNHIPYHVFDNAVIGKFRGAFDGNGYAIRNLVINCDSGGLFSGILSGKVVNLGIENCNMIGSHSVGALAGHNIYGTISNCYVIGSVAGCYDIGGLVGYNSGVISDCYAEISITCTNLSSDNIGGLVGEHHSGEIRNCHVAGTISGGQQSNSGIGGLVGYFWARSSDLIIKQVTGCSTDVSVIVGDSSRGIGGLIGIADNFNQKKNSIISSCHVNGTVKGGRRPRGLGGLIGYIRGVTINNCYAKVKVTGGDWSRSLGGFAGGELGGGSNPATITSCYATGDVIGGHYSELLGGFIGNADQDGHSGSYLLLTNCHATGVVKGGESSKYLGGFAGVIGKSAVNCYAEGQVVGMDKSSDIGGLTGLNTGMLSCCYASGSVSGTGDSSRLGGLVGSNWWGIINNCYASGSVSGTGDSSEVGGLVGLNFRGVINNCYAIGDVLGNDAIGGLVGGQTILSLIKNCYSAGSIDGYRVVGGLIGFNGGGLENCYSSCRISCESDLYGALAGWLSIDGNFTHCFWDIEIDNTIPAYTIRLGNWPYEFIPVFNILGETEGKTRIEMQTLSTFIDAGWDFIFETENGTEDIWFIREGIDYPKLWWQQHRPIADIKEDMTAYAGLDGFAEVRLDGTGSYDEDLDALEYFWYNDANELIAAGAEPNLILPVGEYVIDLIVNDGIEDSEPNSCKVTVIGAAETATQLLPKTLNRRTSRPHVIGRLELTGFSAADIDPSEPMVLMPCGVVSDRMLILPAGNGSDSVTLAGFFDNTALMEAVNDGVVEVSIAVKLTSGQWVYGEDQVTVK